MSIQFTKLSATGNDFILFDNRAGLFRGDEEPLFRTLCTRRVAIGADGILLIENPPPSSLRFTDLRFRMRYFNRDGRESEMCGNGARAAAYYAFRRHLAPAEMQFEVSGELYHAVVAGNKVRLRMQKPRHLNLTPRALEDAGMEEGGFVNTGVPHYVVFVQDVDQVEVAKLGMKYRRHAIFQPAGTNVNFVAVGKPSHLHLRTYERGVEEETLACGTGAVASAVLAHLKKQMPFPIHLATRGGGLTVYGDDKFENLELEGDVRLVYHGEFDLKEFT
ncbi:MAG: diaminopimelate epimerase [candidate division KSB1 bacterium]|nr:diaminopimelate epimerase [candidate division KSB1 bacterium]MDZ7365975.1 diaminopimelate epimerase [candidate division KSB1 bacterium]MDZ7404091.1 diaminopimelate epimerase [candidate division KSB1 bacterium]